MEKEKDLKLTRNCKTELFFKYKTTCHSYVNPTEVRCFSQYLNFQQNSPVRQASFITPTLQVEAGVERTGVPTAT